MSGKENNIVSWKNLGEIFIHILIFFNAVILGLMTSPDLTVHQKALLERMDSVCLAIFTIELCLRFLFNSRSFFHNGWNIFDVVVIGSSIICSLSAISALRALRVLRLLRLISAFVKLRLIVRTLWEVLPSMGWISFLLMIIFYIYAVVGNQIFGSCFPEFFGDFSSSMFTLFQIMTLDAWSDQVARPILEEYPFSWVYFLTFILLTAVLILNIVVGIVVETINRAAKIEQMNRHEKNFQHDELLKEVIELQLHLQRLEEQLTIKSASDTEKKIP